jgi:thiamine-phosphate pyrophosphorylase
MFELPKLYPITDLAISQLSHAEQVIRLSEGGATVIQLREKNLAAKGFFKEAEKALGKARERGVKIIINDRVDIALALKADGVHLGQDDLPPAEARQLLGPDAIIGFSTHNFEQAERAVQLPVDYIAIGPIFPTSTKQNPDPPIGLPGLSQVRQVVGEIPLVAIGGITAERASEVLAAGADSVAIVRGLLSDPNKIAAQTKNLLAQLS